MFDPPDRSSKVRRRGVVSSPRASAAATAAESRSRELGENLTDRWSAPEKKTGGSSPFFLTKKGGTVRNIPLELQVRESVSGMTLDRYFERSLAL